MSLTTAGRDYLAQAAINDSPVFFNAGNACIGVGNGSTAFAAAQTDLAGASKLRKGMEPTYPQRTNNVLTFRSSFGPSEANYAWNEWGVFNALTGGVMLSRKVESLGTKTSGTWVLTVTVTVNAV